ncbi:MULTISPECIES: aspartate ammonia-lyase [Porphyromonas]|uniref:Aspartate ammonia-lyase n=1 Tax=Porphyromonas canoris TaxID=36875 RepID=A0ABR4XK98_9PORP|nr:MULTISPECIES: aspartate ammonia-lyase [Porphyromonas]KGL52847.1 aspartate ammonia-lyase [Porphyromonas canoris]KGN70309.1 aspartate ammonia-lyase [Porphyromonas sp. COT-108 OH1349]KGN91822.1 aspartate ammonia-lyase [Porphyromonas canoris]KGN95595.1 aspartate ammonia-lyase [Porphyromonas sp. COT-108 OH2963]
MADTKKTRIESDLLGSREIEEKHLYGVQTLRAIENFNISTFRLNETPDLLKGLAYTKMGAAMANVKQGIITQQQFDAIMQACREILDGKHTEAFPIDMIQGGAGTSTNMNANEVIANRALEIMGHRRGEYKYCSPNDHVNASQSTNDAFPTAIHLGIYSMHLRLIEHLKSYIASLQEKSREFADVLKMGRTQLEDAVPMTMGQTFGGFASILEEEIANLDHAAGQLLTVNMGATAIGTGICSEPGYAELCVEALREITGWDIKLAHHLVGATSDTSHIIGYSQAMKRLAVKLSKIANDIRLMGSGPRCGLGELDVPARQPGSSIMPGKVNPVIPEVMSQICYKVIGNDVCVTMAGEAAQLELNAMEPVMAQCAFESGHYLMRGMDTMRDFCIRDMKANREKCLAHIHNSMGIVTALNPIIGYKNSTKIAKKAAETGRGVYELVLEMGILTKEDLDTILAPENMIKPVKLDIKPLKDLPEA